MFTFLAVTKWQKMCEIKCCAVLSPVGDWEAGLTGLDLGRSPEEGGRGSLVEIKLGTTRFGRRPHVLNTIQLHDVNL